jgi:hypothetical protein
VTLLAVSANRSTRTTIGLESACVDRDYDLGRPARAAQVGAIHLEVSGDRIEPIMA